LPSRSFLLFLLDLPGVHVDRRGNLAEENSDPLPFFFFFWAFSNRLLVVKRDAEEEGCSLVESKQRAEYLMIVARGTEFKSGKDGVRFVELLLFVVEQPYVNEVPTIVLAAGEYASLYFRESLLRRHPGEGIVLLGSQGL